MRTRVKICCIAAIDELRCATEAGADAVGLVGPMPSGPGPIAPPLIKHLARQASPAVATFLLSSSTTAAELLAEIVDAGTTVLQIVDAVPVETYAMLRDALPALKLVQVIHVEDERAVAEARGLAPHVDGLLLDSGRPGAAVKELGGTGRRHDWRLSREIVRSVPCPVFLAGGLTADNVAEAIRTARPYGVDICSGVRRDGRLDPQKLQDFMGAVAAA